MDNMVSFSATGPGVSSTGENPSINIAPGSTVTFVLNCSGHPFRVRVVGTNVPYTGFSRQGAQSGSATLTIPANETQQLYYTCAFHGDRTSTGPETGLINITSASLSPAPTLTPGVSATP
jgi:hypothetical protein